MQKLRDEKNKEYNDLKKKTEKDLWKEDLEVFEKTYKKFLKYK